MNEMYFFYAQTRFFAKLYKEDIELVIYIKDNLRANPDHKKLYTEKRRKEIFEKSTVSPKSIQNRHANTFLFKLR